jgi:Tol biopolymer transport system component
LKTLPLCRLAALCALVLACRTHGVPAHEAPIPIAVVPFAVAGGGSPPPIDVAAAIAADLASSSRFEAMAVADMPSRPADMAGVDFEAWRRAKVDYLVIGLVARVHDGGHEVEFRLVDVQQETALVAFQVPSAPDQLRSTARQIAAIVHRRLGDGVGAPRTAAVVAPP